MRYDPEKITYFARTDARGQDVPFGIKAKDRQRHVYVIGKTGMGKSTLLENMAAQDIMNGEGMAFIDPHGSAAEALLSYIPEHRKDDVVYFSPADTDFPVSFNIMEDVGPDKRHLVVSGLMSVFKKIWVDAWSARMEYILQNTILALLEFPGSTLIGVNRMLSDKAYREMVVANVKDPGVRSFWVDEFAKYNERYMQEAGDAIKNKIGQFTANPVIRNIIGQPKSSFDIRKIMDEKKIIIMNLSKGLIGETNANLLGSMLTTRIYLAAMSRADLSPEKMREMPNFYFYVDEFQSFANATFANILSEARKYHLNLTIAHQYIEQMEEEVRNAVFGNVGTIISFRVGPFDAEVLETIFSPQFLATDIVNLGFAQVYLTLMIDGIGSQPFSARTLPSIQPPSISCKSMVVAASRAQFARPRPEVEVEIQKFHEPVVRSPRPTAHREESGGTNGAVREGMQSERRTDNREEVRAPGREAEPSRPPRQEGNGHSERPHRSERTDRPGPSERPVQSDRAGRTERFDNRDRASREREVSRAPRPHSETEVSRSDAGRAHTHQVTTHATQTSDQKSKPEKSSHLDDLRSVLRSIVHEENNGSKTASSKTVPAPDLKQAVTAVLEHPPVSSQPPAGDSPTQTHSPARSEVVAIPNLEEKTNAPATVTPEEHAVTAHELERMMRVTTNDKPL